MSQAEQNPAKTLDNIREGGSKLLATARSRMAELGTLLDEGRFVSAQGCCADLFGKIKALADAESNLGAFAHLSVIRAEDMVVGMQVGTHTVADLDIQRDPCPSGGHDHVLVKVQWDDGTLEEYDGAQEIAVAATDE